MAAESELNDRITQAAEAAARRGYLGGELQAAWRQGLNELGAALKAFPDSLQVDEPGAIWNPLYRDIPGNNRPTVHGGPTGVSMPTNQTGPAPPNGGVPSVAQILDNPGAFPPPGQAAAQQLGESIGQGQPQANAMDAGQAPAMNTGQAPSLNAGGPAPPEGGAPSAKEILDNPKAYLPPDQQQHGQQHQQTHGMGMGI